MDRDHDDERVDVHQNRKVHVQRMVQAMQILVQGKLKDGDFDRIVCFQGYFAIGLLLETGSGGDERVRDDGHGCVENFARTGLDLRPRVLQLHRSEEIGLPMEYLIKIQFCNTK